MISEEPVPRLVIAFDRNARSAAALDDLPPELTQLIEDVTVDSKGRAVPKLYSKLQASKELRAMLNLGAKSEAPDVTKCLMLS